MRSRGAAIGLVALLVAAALLVRPRSARPETPEATVAAFFDAAGRGDDETYLGLVTGRLETALRSARDVAGIDAFRDDLRRSSAAVKGFAFLGRELRPGGDVALRVEIVFADRNEVQEVRLSPVAGGWAIAELGTVDTSTPEIPYGTPVTGH